MKHGIHICKFALNLSSINAFNDFYIIIPKHFVCFSRETIKKTTIFKWQSFVLEPSTELLLYLWPRPTEGADRFQFDRRRCVVRGSGAGPTVTGCYIISIK